MRYIYDFNAQKLSDITHTRYELPQVDGPISVKEYLISQIKGSRGCLLRFIKKVNIELTEITFDLTEINGKDEDISTTRYVISKNDIPLVAAGEMFTPNCAVPVDDKCEEVRVDIVKIISGDYIYTFEGGRVCVDYPIEEKWEDPDKHKDKKKSKKKYVRTRRVKSKKSRPYGEHFKVKSKLGKRTHILPSLSIFTVLFLIEVILKWHLVRVVPIEEIRTAIINGTLMLLELTWNIFVYILSFDYMKYIFEFIGSAFEGLGFAIESILQMIINLI